MAETPTKLPPSDLRLLAKYHDNQGSFDQSVITALEEAADEIEQLRGVTDPRAESEAK